MIVGFLKPTIDTYTQKSILCAPICAIFEISIFKSTENSRVDLIIGATIRSTRCFQNTKKTTARHGHGQTCWSIFSSTTPPFFINDGTIGTDLRRSTSNGRRHGEKIKWCIVFQPSKVSQINCGIATGKSPPPKMHLLTINFFPPTKPRHDQNAHRAG